MNQFIKNSKLKQWIWFFALWLSGFIAMSAIAYPIKWIIKTFM